MEINVQFHSYFKDLAGCAQTTEAVSDGSTLEELCRQLVVRFPRLAAMQKSMLIAVGVEYQSRGYVLKNGDEVSLFPPVQGG
jgi:molybdopterin converting factor small subunit